jgi:hypothetical protein
MNERNLGNFLLNEAKNVGDAKASARLFNEVQERIYRLQPFDAPQNKSKKTAQTPGWFWTLDKTWLRPPVWFSNPLVA